MSEIVTRSAIPAMSPHAIANVRALEERVLAVEQTPIATSHVFHAGTYARTITIPAQTVLTGVLIKIATLLIFDGDAQVYLDGESRRFTGHHVLPASAGRKQAFVALAETHLTMIFATDARTVEDAERAFTDEADLLGSRRDLNHVTITGE